MINKITFTWKIYMNVIYFFAFILPLILTEYVGQNDKRKSHRRLKILIYSPTIAFSHIHLMGKIADTLAEVGHEVHLMKFKLSDENLNALNESKLAHKIYEISNSETSSDKFDIQKTETLSNLFEGHSIQKLLFPTSILWKEIGKIIVNVCEDILVNNRDLIEQLRLEKFDVGIAEMYNLCPFGLFHHLSVRTKLAVSAIPFSQPIGRRFGVPTFSSFVTNLFAPLELNSFWERTLNFYNDFIEYYSITDMTVNEEQGFFVKAFGDDFPSLKTIVRNVSLYFVNSNIFLDMPRPISNKIINIGGLSQIKSRPLNAEISSLLDDETHKGVVLVSFGTMSEANKMGDHLKLALLRAFANSKEYHFIWKYDLVDPKDKEIFANLAPNVHAFTWFDQISILLHPRLRLFVSHCGQNSLTEAATAGVPIVGIPLFADQMYNAIVAKKRGLAVWLDIRDLLKSKIADRMIGDALQNVLQNPKYRSNAKQIARKFKLTPFSAKEKLIRWVEFAAEFDELNELNLPWDEELGLLAYYSLDVILVTALLLTVVFWVFFKLLLFCLQKFNNFAGKTKGIDGRRQKKSQRNSHID